MNQIHPMQLPGSQRPVKGKCGAKLIKSKKKYGKIRYLANDPIPFLLPVMVVIPYSAGF